MVCRMLSRRADSSAIGLAMIGGFGFIVAKVNAGIYEYSGLIQQSIASLTPLLLPQPTPILFPSTKTINSNYSMHIHHSSKVIAEA